MVAADAAGMEMVGVEAAWLHLVSAVYSLHSLAATRTLSTVVQLEMNTHRMLGTTWNVDEAEEGSVLQMEVFGFEDLVPYV